jgi:hypothetical protein
MNKSKAVIAVSIAFGAVVLLLVFAAIKTHEIVAFHRTNHQFRDVQRGDGPGSNVLEPLTILLDTILRAAGPHYQPHLWPSFGTLLGITRRARLIAYDDDVDLCIENKYFRGLVNRLRRRLDPRRYLIAAVRLPRMAYVQIIDRQTRLHAEIAAIDVRGDNVVRRMWRRDNFDLKVAEVYPLQPTMIHGVNGQPITIYCPAKPASILRKMYGRNWATPTKPND